MDNRQRRRRTPAALHCHSDDQAPGVVVGGTSLGNGKTLRGCDTHAAHARKRATDMVFS
jgi:hypothetical protein